MSALNKIEKINFVRKIPKLIHQTYPSKDIPECLQSNIEHVKSTNPDWKYKLYSDEDIKFFIEKEYGLGILKIFNRISLEYGAARADLFRYLLMYKLGGVYLDIKSSVSRPFSEVIKHEDCYFISQWGGSESDPYREWGIHDELKNITGGEFQQWYIISSPGHPFLYAVIQTVIYNINKYCYLTTGFGRLGVLRLTGPIAYTKAIDSILEIYPHTRVKSEKDLGLIYSVLEKKPSQSHVQLFNKHYSKNITPIVKNNSPRRLLNYVFFTGYFLLKNSNNLARRIIAKL
jgi:mannosyltransferase OCH1-like enzyme